MIIVVLIQELLEWTKINAIRQKNVIQGSFRSVFEAILYVYIVRKTNQS